MTTLGADAFGRTVTGGWGTSDSGFPWTIQSTQQAAASVADGVGIINHLSTSYRNIDTRAAITPAIDVDYTSTWWLDQLPVGGNASFRFSPRSVTSAMDYHVRIAITPAGVVTAGMYKADIGGLTGAGNQTIPVTLAPGTKMRTRVQAIGINPTVIRHKTWLASDPEPAAWMHTASDSQAELQVALTPFNRWGLATSVTNFPFINRVDDVVITNGASDVPEPVVGAVGLHLSLTPDQDTITIGYKRLTAGAVIKLVLLRNGGEEQRVTGATNATTQWGNGRFTGLTPGTDYTVRFLADDTDQGIEMKIKTLPDQPADFVAIGGSCQFGASNHPVWDRIREEDPIFLAHMGDMMYADATTDTGWRSSMEGSMTAPRFAKMLEETSMTWTPDNHDRIITNPGGAGGGLNLGETDPQTNLQWRHLAGNSGFATSDTLGQAWRVGRVLFIQTDGWSVRDDPDFDSEPRTFLGAAQKQWFKDTILNNDDAVLIIWFCAWTARNNANGRWNSFPTESNELENWFNDRPHVKAKTVLVGGDSHSVQADDGSRTNMRFNGMPSLNMSGFNRSGDAGDGGTGWSIINTGQRAPGSIEGDWGGYSRMTFSDDGTMLRFRWDAVRVNIAGEKDIMARFERSYGQPWGEVHVDSGQADEVYAGPLLIWTKDLVALDVNEDPVITEPWVEQRRNLFLDPRAKIGSADNWAGDPSTFARVDSGLMGRSAMQFITPSAGAGRGGPRIFNLIGGTRYSFKFWFVASFTSNTFAFYIRNTLSTSTGQSSLLTGQSVVAGVPKYFEVTNFVTTSSAGASALAAVNANVPAGGIFEFTDVIAELGSKLNEDPDYFDGDTFNALRLRTRWLDLPNRSMSVLETR